MQKASFIHGGYERAYAALEPSVREQVMDEYAERLARTRSWRRWLLMREIDGEVERRVHAQAPPHALY